MKKTLCAMILTATLSVMAQVEVSAQNTSTPALVHSLVGDRSPGCADEIQLINIGKKQQYAGGASNTRDTDIFSPKSVTFSRDGKKIYVNNLEGGTTVVYSTDSLEKTKVIKHTFGTTDLKKTAALSGFYPFTHYLEGDKRSYMGKPVESTWSHQGRYLWVTYYRRSFDMNAQDPSAVAVIDTNVDSIIRIFETGPLPKMIATSNSGNLIAVTHWGDNTVGFIDISSASPLEWHHLPPVIIGHKLNLDFPLDKPVNRDKNSGFLLRGTLFTPDDKYLLVSSMAGPLQIIDLERMEHIGRVDGLYGIRHLERYDTLFYGSKNVGGTIVKVNINNLMHEIKRAVDSGTKNIATPEETIEVKVGTGARTLSVTPDGRYVIVACNSASAVYVVDAVTMKVVDSIRCDSYPVGLSVSPDGHIMAVTSQGRNYQGGNALNIFRIERFGSDIVETEAMEVEASDLEDNEGEKLNEEDNRKDSGETPFNPLTQWDIILYISLIIGILIIIIILFRRKKRK